MEGAKSHSQTTNGWVEISGNRATDPGDTQEEASSLTSVPPVETRVSITADRTWWLGVRQRLIKAGGDGHLLFVDLWLRNTSRIGRSPKWNAPFRGERQAEPHPVSMDLGGVTESFCMLKSGSQLARDLYACGPIGTWAMNTGGLLRLPPRLGLALLLFQWDPRRWAS